MNKSLSEVTWGDVAYFIGCVVVVWIIGSVCLDFFYGSDGDSYEDAIKKSKHHRAQLKFVDKHLPKDRDGYGNGKLDDGDFLAIAWKLGYPRDVIMSNVSMDNIWGYIHVHGPQLEIKHESDGLKPHHDFP